MLFTFYRIKPYYLDSVVSSLVGCSQVLSGPRTTPRITSKIKAIIETIKIIFLYFLIFLTNDFAIFINLNKTKYQNENIKSTYQKLKLSFSFKS